MKMTWITGLCGVALVAGLSACGPLHGDDPRAASIRRVVSNLVPSNAAGSTEASDSTPAVQAPTTLTRAQIDAQDSALLRLSVISFDATGLVFFAGTNGSKVTWISAEGASFIFDGGLLVGTRGLGDDLMGSDVAAAAQSLSGGGNHTRVLDFLNGLSQIERQAFQCVTIRTGRENITIVEKTYATSIFEETCTGESGGFKNIYWRDANGVIWQSRQWISAAVGYLAYQRL